MEENPAQTVVAEDVPEVIEKKPLDLKKLVEAALFIAGKFLTLEELSKYVPKTSSAKIKQAIDEIKADYEKRNSPIALTEEDGKFKLDVKPEYLDAVKNLAPQMDMRKAVLTTLSYIAFKQPITQSKLVKLFGNRIYDYAKELVQRGLVNAVKHKRTKMLTTAKKLGSYLGSNDLERVRKIQLEKIEQVLKAEIAKEDAADKNKQVDEVKQLEKKKELSLEEWQQLLEHRRVKEQARKERAEKRKKAKQSNGQTN